MGGVVLAICQCAALAVALGGAIYGTKASFTRVPKIIKDTTSSAWLRTCALLTTIWLTIRLIAAIINSLLMITRWLPLFMHKLTPHLTILNALIGAPAICLLLIIQTVILSVCTQNIESSVRDSVRGVYRFVIFGLLLLLPLSVANVALTEYIYFSSGDMGHLRSMIAVFVIDGLSAVIKLIATAINLICLRSKAGSSPVPYHKPLLIINLLSFGRDAFQIIFSILIRLGIARDNGRYLPVNAIIVLSVLSVIVTTWATVACLIMVVELVANYASALAEPALQPDETSPLLGGEQNRATVVE